MYQTKNSVQIMYNVLEGSIDMISFKYVVKDSIGIHARPAAMFAQACVNFKSSVTLCHKDKVADGKNVASILTLAVQP